MLYIPGVGVALSQASPILITLVVKLSVNLLNIRCNPPRRQLSYKPEEVLLVDLTIFCEGAPTHVSEGVWRTGPNGNTTYTFSLGHQHKALKEERLHLGKEYAKLLPVNKIASLLGREWTGLTLV